MQIQQIHLRFWQQISLLYVEISATGYKIVCCFFPCSRDRRLHLAETIGNSGEIIGNHAVFDEGLYSRTAFNGILQEKCALLQGTIACTTAEMPAEGLLYPLFIYYYFIFHQIACQGNNNPRCTKTALSGPLINN